MADDAFPSRVRFFDRQFLQARDLTDEQLYHLRMRWRHNLALHSWGIVTGLDVTIEDANTGSIKVARGMAFDGYGRELVLAQPMADRAVRVSNADYDVLLLYSWEEPPPSLNGGAARTRCPGPASASRRIEKPMLQVKATTDRLLADPNRPGEVPSGDLDFRADQLPPEDPTQQWPVLLGRLVLRDGNWIVDSSVRRYAGLIAERIEAPSRPAPETVVDRSQRTVILAGSDPTLSAYRFAVVTTDDQDPMDPDQKPPLLGIRETANGHQIELRTEWVSVAADMVMRSGSVLEFQPNPVGTETTHNLTRTGREQWRIYHHLEPPASTQSGAKSATTGDAGPAFSDEMRITMPAAPTGTNQVSIGAFTDKGVYTPILTVKNDGSVAIYGNLTVTGGITNGRITDAASDQTAAATSGPSDEEILERAASILAASNNSAQSLAILSAIATRDPGKDALASFVPANLDVGRVQNLGAALWGSNPQSVALGNAVGGSTATTTPTIPGARVGTFQDFLGALPDQIRADTSTAPKVDTVKVIGDWLFTLAGADAHPISEVDYSQATDDAIEQLATGFKKQPASDQLKKLIAELIKGSDATTEMITQLVAGKTVKVAEAMAKSQSEKAIAALFTHAAQAVGRSFSTDGSVLNSVAKGLFQDTPGVDTITDRVKALTAAIFDYPRAADSNASITLAENVGNKLVGLLLDDAGLPVMPTGSDEIPNTTRLKRFLTYLILGGDAQLPPRLVNSHRWFVDHPAPPPPPTP